MRRLWPILALLFATSCGDAGAQVTASSVKVRWTATGDDGLVGQASGYDLRYSTSPIDSLNFGQVTRWMTMPMPSAAGETDSVTVAGLAPATTYYFAIKVVDEAANWSAISNVVVATTLRPTTDLVAPFRVTDLRPRP